MLPGAWLRLRKQWPPGHVLPMVKGWRTGGQTKPCINIPTLCWMQPGYTILLSTHFISQSKPQGISARHCRAHARNGKSKNLLENNNNNNTNCHWVSFSSLLPGSHCFLTVPQGSAYFLCLGGFYH